MFEKINMGWVGQKKPFTNKRLFDDYILPYHFSNNEKGSKSQRVKSTKEAGRYLDFVGKKYAVVTWILLASHFSSLYPIHWCSGSLPPSLDPLLFNASARTPSLHLPQVLLTG